MIICIGDSNTYGYDPRDFAGRPFPHPWPELLAAELGEVVLNLGANGETVPADPYGYALWTDRIRAHQTASGPDPVTYMILLGTNDILNRFHPRIERIVGRMEAFLLYLKAYDPQARIRLLAPPPLTGPERERMPYRTELAEAFRLLAGRCGCAFADTADASPGMSFDGIHLSEEGHVALGHFLADLLRDADGSDF